MRIEREIMKLSLKELTAQIDTRARLERRGTSIEVIIIDVKQAFGRVDYKIKPVSGDGSEWVRGTSLRFREREEGS